MNKEIYNKIFFGPPGTGKSFKVKTETEGKKVFRITFHEDFSYYDFVGQYKPVVIRNFDSMISTKENGTRSEKEPAPVISYNFVPGVFTLSYVEAYKNPNEKIYLVIEEINRGNCSAIFGDIFQLLDRDDDGSKYPIQPSSELALYLELQGIEYKTLSIPGNLKIIATMNTSDQSLFPIDSAFKRRWQQEYCKIDYNFDALKKVKIEGTKTDWLDFIQEVNEKILNTLNNEDKQIGHWFIQPNNNIISQEEFKYKVLSYLYYDVFKHHREQIFKSKSFSKLVEQSIVGVIDEIRR